MEIRFVSHLVQAPSSLLIFFVPCVPLFSFSDHDLDGAETQQQTATAEFIYLFHWIPACCLLSSADWFRKVSRIFSRRFFKANLNSNWNLFSSPHDAYLWVAPAATPFMLLALIWIHHIINALMMPLRVWQIASGSFCGDQSTLCSTETISSLTLWNRRVRGGRFSKLGSREEKQLQGREVN